MKSVCEKISGCSDAIRNRYREWQQYKEWLQSGKYFLENHSFQNALVYFTNIEKKGKKKYIAHIWRQMAICLEKLGRSQQEITKRLVTLCAIDDRNAEMSMFIANRYSLQGKHEQAELWLKKTILIDPKGTISYINLCEILQRQNKLDEIPIFLNRLYNLYPKDKILLLKIVQIFQKTQDDSNAATIYWQLLNLQPQNSDYIVRYYAKIFFADLAYNRSAAEKLINRGLSLHDHNQSKLLYYKACVQESSKKKVEALKRLIDEGNADGDTYVLLADLLMDEDRYDECVQVLKPVAQIHRHHAYFQMALARSYINLRNVDAYNEVFDRFIQDHNEDSSSLFVLGKFYDQRNQSVQAQKYYILYLQKCRRKRDRLLAYEIISIFYQQFKDFQRCVHFRELIEVSHEGIVNKNTILLAQGYHWLGNSDRVQEYCSKINRNIGKLSLEQLLIYAELLSLLDKWDQYQLLQPLVKQKKMRQDIIQCKKFDFEQMLMFIMYYIQIGKLAYISSYLYDFELAIERQMEDPLFIQTYLRNVWAQVIPILLQIRMFELATKLIDKISNLLPQMIERDDHFRDLYLNIIPEWQRTIAQQKSIVANPQL